ncbi:MAG: ribosome-associated translation inhibitor RaiA [Planctomycetota bacterium]
MQITLTAVRGDVTPDMKDYATKKLSKLGKFLTQGVMDAHVQLSIEQPWFEAETVLHVKNSGRLVAKSKADDMFKAIDGMVEKLERQMKDLKEKRSDTRKRASQRAQAVMMEEAIQQAFSIPNDEKEEE